MRNLFSILYLIFFALLVVVITAPAVAQEANLAESYPGFPSGLSPYLYYSYSLPQLLAEDLMLRKMQIRFLDTFVNPNEYTVGPGDQFGILFTANEVSDLSGTISSDGSFFIKSIGSINLGHISLREAIDRITEEIKKNYSKTEVAVQLTGVRVVRIQVVGAVARPGIYYAPAIWRVSEVIALAGGYVPGVSTRHIVLRGFGTDYPVDMMKFDILGDSKSNPMICRGSIIEVPIRKTDRESVSISGLVNRPIALEAVPGDCVTDILGFAGGAKGNLWDMEIIVSSINNSKSIRLDGASPETGNYLLAAGDNVRLFWKAGREKYGIVAALGAVERPGRYPIPDNHFTLARLLEACGGLSDDANPEMIQIYRKTADLFEMSLVSLNPRNHWDAATISIMDGDSLFVPKATGMISVEGAVVSPGLIPYRKGKGIDYYLQQAGGLGFNADRGRMVVINPFNHGKINAAGARELFDGEILLVPQKERSEKP